MFSRFEAVCDELEERLLKILPPQVPPSSTFPSLLLGIGSTIAINYLVHKPNTQLLRKALWPVAVAGCLYTNVTIDLSEFCFLAASSASRWAFSNSPPQYHPLPRKPPLSFIRNLTIVKAVNLIMDESRLIGVAPYSPPLKRSPHGYFRQVLYHVSTFLFLFVLYDFTTYPVFFLDPNGIGEPTFVPKDFWASVRIISAKTGVPPLLVRLGLTASLGWHVYLGMLLVWHMEAALAIGSGIWVGEEFPRLMNQPYASTSLNELWAHRYHQTLKPLFLMATRPFHFLPRAVVILLVFLVSSVYHGLIHFPFHRDLAIWPSLSFFLGCGLGCVLERAFYKFTGRKVQGAWGRVWLWTWLAVISGPLTASWYGFGWAGQFRRDLWEEPSISAVEWLLYTMRGGQSPAETHRKMP